MKRTLAVAALVVIVLASSSNVYSQTKQEIKQQAEAQLRQMTPAEIDAKIREYGMTREQAEAKAREYGVDLNTFLQTHAAAAQVPAPAPVTQAVADTIKKVVDTTAQGIKQAIKQEVKEEAKQVAREAARQEVKKEAQAPEQAVAGPQELPLFGLNIFQTRAESFQPTPSISDKEYVIGSGDVLKLSMWGTVEMMNEFTVDTEGRITIPTVGPVFLSGYTLDKAKDRLKYGMSRSYAGLVGSPPTIFMDVSISRLRPIRVFIMGEVVNPGGYYVSNFASVFNSLFVVNGPKSSGSIRQVQLMRNNKLVSKADLYDYLIGATKTSDVRVNDNDIIFVPLRGRTVGIKGEVLRPARYELLPGQQLSKLLEFSGGIRSSMYLDRVQIDRIIPFEQRRKGELDRRIFDIDFSEIMKGKGDYTLEDGDIVTIFPIVDEQKNYVTIDGAVWRPGRYQLEKVPTILDLILAADSLHPTVYMDRADIMRTDPDKHLIAIHVDLNKVLINDPNNNIKLEPLDRVRIFSIYDFNAARSYTLSGHVRHPGEFPYADSLSLYDVLIVDGGMRDSLFRAATLMERADVIRFNPDRITTRIISFNLGSLIDAREGNFLVEPGDRIILYPVTAIDVIDKTVVIDGKVKKPGEYRLTQNMTLLDLLLQAGGYTEDAWAVQAEIARISRKGPGRDSLVFTRFARLPDLFDTTKTKAELLESPAGKYLLHNRDQVYVRPNPDYLPQQSVSIEGEVRYPGTYVLNVRNERLSDIVRRGGGLMSSGYARGGSLVRSGQKYRANFEDALADPRGDADIILQPGDRMIIPRRPFTVLVQGEVRNPGIYAYVGDKSKSFYIDRAGDVTDSADVALISYPEGYVEKVGIGWFSRNPSIPDGTTITVTKMIAEPAQPPTESKPIDWSATIKDSFAVVASAATIIYLVSQVTK
jgi:protein involved in polysaccharide export with SLBB domain